MPWHGKSYPPEGWQDEEYRLTTELYVETILAFCNALALDKPALIGCSIGGRIVLHLANAHSDKFRALIGVEGADYQKPWYDTSWLHRGDVHGGEVCARSEEHTSELQSLMRISYAVFCLKKITEHNDTMTYNDNICN